MEIKITSPTRQTVYPDIDGNLSLPESERFGVEIRQPSDQSLAEHTVKTTFTDNGEPQTVYDPIGRAKAWIDRLHNPPTLVVEGKKRPMRTQDLFRYSELASVLRQVNEKIDDMSSDREDESKN